MSNAIATKFVELARKDSNLQLPDPESGVLPIELRAIRRVLRLSIAHDARVGLRAGQT